MPRVVVFDLDDTLYPERSYARSGLRHVGAYLSEAHGITDASDRLVALMEAGVRGRIFNAVLEKEGLSMALVPELVARYRAHLPAIALYPDALATLGRLRGSFELALITDGPAVCQRQKLRALELERWFTPALVTDEAGRDRYDGERGGGARSAPLQQHDRRLQRAGGVHAGVL